jgi:hypothetical protein
MATTQICTELFCLPNVTDNIVGRFPLERKAIKTIAPSIPRSRDALRKAG